MQKNIKFGREGEIIANNYFGPELKMSKMPEIQWVKVGKKSIGPKCKGLR